MATSCVSSPTVDWAIDTLSGVDQDAGLVYFTGTKDGPTESHLYSVPLEGGQITRLTQEPGTHSVTLDHASNRFVDTFSNTNTPPTVTLRSCRTARRFTPFTRQTTPG